VALPGSAGVGERDRLLIDEQLLEGEGHVLDKTIRKE
jgi:hypothetical protein